MSEIEAELTSPATVNGSETQLTLSGDGATLRWKTHDGSDRCLELDSEVLGFSPAEDRPVVTVRAFLKREITPLCDGGASGGGLRRARRDFVFELPSQESKRVWCERLRGSIDRLARPKRLLILVNPFGGKKSAVKVFHKEVKPLLVAADIQYTVQETQYQLHAKAIVHSWDLSNYDGIVCVSGDGILVEVVNGLLQREDWETAIKVPLGVVPAGTGNGMAKSILDSVDEMCSPSNAVFAIIRGHRRALDVATVLQEGTRFFSVLMLTWGLVADIDIESEKFRWMGSSRIEFYSLLRILCLRKYEGHVCFIPAPGFETFGEPLTQDGDTNTNSFHIWKQDLEGNVKIQQCGYQGSTTNFDISEWRTVKGPFISVWLHNVPWASEDTMPAPEAKFSDGYLDLILMRDCSKLALLTLLTKLNDGTHIKSPYIMYLKVKAFYLKPGNRAGEPRKGGIIDSDGEVLARGEATFRCGQRDLMSYGPPIHMTVDRGLATIFAPQ